MIILLQNGVNDWTHAPFNACFTELLNDVFPDQKIKFFADHNYITNLRNNYPSLEEAGIEFSPIATAPLGSPPLTHLIKDGRALESILRSLREPCLLVLLHTSGEMIRLAQGLVALRCAAGQRLDVLFILHGNVHQAFMWRSKNPLHRWLDLRSGLDSVAEGHISFLALEDVVKSELERRLPHFRGTLDALPHPVVEEEARQLVKGSLSAPPTRFGMLGVATLAKGADLFAGIAARVTATLPGSAKFSLLGPIRPEVGTLDGRSVDYPADGRAMERTDYLSALAELDYAVFPFRAEYYALAASGTLIDAVTARKPIITLNLPMFQAFFEAHGDVGYLCADIAEMESVIVRLSASPEPERWRDQSRRMEAALTARLPKALVKQMRAIVERRFIGLFS